MKLFISWSGEASKVAALGLKSFVSNVIQSVDAFVSDTDIDRGSKWADVITSQLNTTSFGILCITPDNLEAPWIMFEAGCLSKGIDDLNRVIPLMFNTEPSDLRGPLTIFNASKPIKEGILNIVKSINKQCEKPLETDRLVEIFEKWWPDLEVEFGKVAEILSSYDSGAEKREISPEHSILEEVLSLTRKTSNSTSKLEKAIGEISRLVAPTGMRAFLRNPALTGLTGMAPSALGEQGTLYEPGSVGLRSLARIAKKPEDTPQDPPVGQE